MKKLVIACLVSCLSSSIFAAGVYIDNAECWNEPQEHLGGCIQNKAGMRFTELKFKEAYYYQDGSSNVGDSYIQFTPDYYINVLYSVDELKKEKIKKIEFSLLFNGETLPGCVMEVTRHTSRQPTLVMRGVPGYDLHCAWG